MDVKSLEEVNREGLRELRPPNFLYFFVLGGLMTVVGWAIACWVYQVRTGMGVSGLNIPVAWGTYIANYVFWVAIGMSGTMLSAMLYLVRSEFRKSISRATEVMTLGALTAASVCPLFHLGRLWVFFFVVPYPSQRQIWPNYTSPLVWDVLAVTIYLTVSVIFFFVGMIPDAAVARDHFDRLYGPKHWRTTLYRWLSMGWYHQLSQWRHFGRSYLYFAVLATPLAVSIHSVVGWDFAMSLEPGWHTTIYAPYFVSGAIFSGSAMAVTLLTVLRKIFHLEHLITEKHYNALGKMMIVFSMLLAYDYLVEPYMGWYTGDIARRQFAAWSVHGWFAWEFWCIVFLNVICQLPLLFHRVRTNIRAIFTISILANMGMWWERLYIVESATSHDFLPSSWGKYGLSLVEWSINAGLIAYFFSVVLILTKLLPVIPITDIKEGIEPPHPPEEVSPPKKRLKIARRDAPGVLGIFTKAEQLIEAIRKVRDSEFAAVEAYTPYRVDAAVVMLHGRHSPMRFWVFAGVLVGACGAMGLEIGTSLINSLIVGGKPVIALVPFMVITFEGAVLMGVFFNLFGLVLHARLWRVGIPVPYLRRFSVDRFGLFIECRPEQFEQAQALMAEHDAEEVYLSRAEVAHAGV